ncbi:MAG: hypothetical protein RJQ09_01280 [Cyclobacteriaceae bacterium]
MRRSFELFLIVIIAFGCNSPNSVTIPDIKVTKGDPRLGRTPSGVVTYDTIPFSGSIVTFYPSGTLKTSKQYSEGKQEGLFLGFYKDGSKGFSRPYKQGEKHGGHLGWHPDGSQKFKYNFVAGLSEGTQYDWYPDGSLYKETNYRNGQEFGSQKIWRKDRKLRANYVVRENGRKYGFAGLKRCTNLDSEDESFDRITENTNEFTN